MKNGCILDINRCGDAVFAHRQAKLRYLAEIKKAEKLVAEAEERADEAMLRLQAEEEKNEDMKEGVELNQQLKRLKMKNRERKERIKELEKSPRGKTHQLKKDIKSTKHQVAELKKENEEMFERGAEYAMMLGERDKQLAEKDQQIEELRRQLLTASAMTSVTSQPPHSPASQSASFTAISNGKASMGKRLPKRARVDQD